MNTASPDRILAVEIRAARLGYAVLDGPKLLRDFGAHLFATPPQARIRIARLLAFYRPSLLVLRGAALRYPRNMKTRKGIARIARHEATKSRISVKRVSERDFKKVFAQYSCRDKYDVATILAQWLPELAHRVPPTLTFYAPEPRQMIYFDSIALAIAYLKLRDRSSS